jgi:hypothetical protein
MSAEHHQPTATSRPIKRNLNVAVAQAAPVLHERAITSVLTGASDKVSARIDDDLLCASARKIVSTYTTEVVQAALAAFVAPNPFVEWLLSDQDRLPADFELAI